MGQALDRLMLKLSRPSSLVELATRVFVPHHRRMTRGGITDVHEYIRESGIRTKGRRIPSSLGRGPRVGETGYLEAPKREVLTPSRHPASRLLKGTTETRAERRERLRKKLVDYKTERPLEGGEDIRDVIPGTEVKDYLDLPFLDAMHEKMGIDVDTVSTEEYVKKRNDLFSKENTSDREVAFDGLVVTQKMVNREKAKRLIGAEFDPPPYVVRYKGKSYVINGHHRVVAEALAEKKGTRARVLELS